MRAEEKDMGILGTAARYAAKKLKSQFRSITDGNDNDGDVNFGGEDGSGDSYGRDKASENHLRRTQQLDAFLSADSNGRDGADDDDQDAESGNRDNAIDKLQIGAEKSTRQEVLSYFKEGEEAMRTEREKKRKIKKAVNAVLGLSVASSVASSDFVLPSTGALVLLPSTQDALVVLHQPDVCGTVNNFNEILNKNKASFRELLADRRDKVSSFVQEYLVSREEVLQVRRIQLALADILLEEQIAFQRPKSWPVYHRNRNNLNRPGVGSTLNLHANMSIVDEPDNASNLHAITADAITNNLLNTLCADMFYDANQVTDRRFYVPSLKASKQPVSSSSSSSSSLESSDQPTSSSTTGALSSTNASTSSVVSLIDSLSSLQNASIQLSLKLPVRNQRQVLTVLKQIKAFFYYLDSNMILNTFSHSNARITTQIDHAAPSFSATSTALTSIAVESTTEKQSDVSALSGSPSLPPKSLTQMKPCDRYGSALWKLDSTEFPTRSRRLLRRNYNGSRHKKAKNLLSMTKKEREKVRQLEEQHARNKEDHDNEMDEDEDDDDIDDGDDKEVTNLVDNDAQQGTNHGSISDRQPMLSKLKS
jgi:hypothetical protein